MKREAKVTLAIVAILFVAIFFVVLLALRSQPYVPHGSTPPKPVTYHLGDAIDNTSYVFSSMNGTGAGGNQTYAFFTHESLGNTIQYTLGSNDTIQFPPGNDYAVISYDTSQETITLQELVAMPL